MRWSPESTLKTRRALNKILVSPKPNRRSVRYEVSAHTPTSWWSDQIKTASQSFQLNSPVGILCVYFGNNPSERSFNAAVESHRSTVRCRASHVFIFLYFYIISYVNICQVDLHQEQWRHHKLLHDRHQTASSVFSLHSETPGGRKWETVFVVGRPKSWDVTAAHSEAGWVLLGSARLSNTGEEKGNQRCSVCKLSVSVKHSLALKTWQRGTEGSLKTPRFVATNHDFKVSCGL